MNDKLTTSSQVVAELLLNIYMWVTSISILSSILLFLKLSLCEFNSINTLLSHFVPSFSILAAVIIVSNMTINSYIIGYLGRIAKECSTILGD